MSVRNECKTKRNTDALQNMKQSMCTCFLNNKFGRSLNRGATQARKLSWVVEWLINSKIFSNFNFQVTSQLKPKTDRKVFWKKLAESRTPVDKCPPDIYLRKTMFCVLRHGKETVICTHKLLKGKYFKTFPARKLFYYLLTYFLTYLFTYLLTYLLTHSLHGAGSFLRS